MILVLVCLQHVQRHLQEVEDHQEIWSHGPGIQIMKAMTMRSKYEFMSSLFFSSTFYTFCSSIWVRSPSQRRWAWCIRVHTWMCAFVWVLEVGLFIFRRSTKEMWRFGLNSPCVCTNETVILIVDYLSSCMLLLQGRGKRASSFPLISLLPFLGCAFVSVVESLYTILLMLFGCEMVKHLFLHS